MRRCGGRSKNGMTPRKIQYWVIPPEADAEFVAGMEAVLETYAEAVRSRRYRSLHGRATGAVVQGDAGADPGDEGASEAGRLRVRTGRDGESVYVLRADDGVAAGDGPASTDEGRLGSGGRALLRTRYDVDG